MLNEKKIEDELRENYLTLLPLMRRMEFLLESQIRWHLKSVIYDLESYQRIEIRSRIKDCDRAISSLRRRREGIFDPEQKYSLVELKDLVGFRILVFPEGLISTVNKIITENFSSLKSDPILKKGNPKDIIALKYHGFINEDDKFQSEIQIVSMLIGLFWEVEHFTLYKQDPSFKGVINDDLINKNDKIMDELAEYATLFEKTLNENLNQ